MALKYTDAADGTVTSCEVEDQAGLDAAIAAWVAAQQAAISATGGCDPQVTNNYTTQSVDLCAGGEVEITWTITDLCGTTDVTATFTVTPPTAVTYTDPADATVTSCEVEDQAGLDAARRSSVLAQQAAISATGGCDPQVTNNYTTQSVDLCAGGEVEITWT